jgi:hypothetical protein
MSVYLAKNVTANKLEFSAPKTLNNGSRTVYINYQGEKLTLQTPVMSLPYGVGDWNGKDAKTGEVPAIKKYDLHVSFRGMDTNPALKTLLDKMHEIETKIKDDCFKNRLTWLRDDYDGLKPAVDRLFTPIIKYDKDKETGKIMGKYPPTMKLKLPFDNNTNAFTFDCMDMDGNDLDFASVMTKLKGAKARLIIQLGGMWFAGGKYGCTWKVVKACFQQNSQSKIDFIADSEDEGTGNEAHSDEDVDEDALAMGGAAAAVTKKLKNTTLVEEDEDDEEEEDAVPSPPPAPKKPTPAKPRVPTPEPEEDEEEAEEEEDADSEVEEELPPPPPPKAKAPAKKAAAKK